MKNYRLSISYDGTRYNGWQRQATTNNTICGKLEDILEKMCDTHIDIIGSGRTDAGVHAYNQIANFHCETTYSPREIQDYFNEYLPQDIRILNVDIASDRFHARYNASKKTYVYRIDNQSVLDTFNRKYAYKIDTPLDIAIMKEASALLIGSHDFKSFCPSRKTKKSTVREIYSIEFVDNNDILEIHYTGNGFLYNMVRILTGTLIEVGLGNIPPQEIINIINAENREVAGPTAPPHGLFLKNVTY